MKLKNGIILNEMNGEHYLVDSGAEGERFNGMIKLNSTGCFIVRCLTESTTEDLIVRAMCDTYDVAPETARENLIGFLNALRSVGLIIDEN